jgi:hypothetical protein
MMINQNKIVESQESKKIAPVFEVSRMCPAPSCSKPREAKNEVKTKREQHRKMKKEDP